MSTKKNNYRSTQFRRVAARRCVKKAPIATAHTLLVILKAPIEYRDLGGDYFDRLHPETLQHKLVKRLEALSLTVTVEPMAQTGRDVAVRFRYSSSRYRPNSSSSVSFYKH